MVKKVFKVLLALSMFFGSNAGLVKANINIHVMDIGSSGSAIIGKSWDWLVFSKKQDKHDSLFMFDTNKPDSEPVDMQDKISYVWGLSTYLISNGYDMIFYDPWDVELFSYNTLKRQRNWTTQIYKPGWNYFHSDWTIPVLNDGKLYLKFGADMMIIDAKTGQIEKPCSDKELSSVMNLNNMANVEYGKYMFSYEFMYMYCYDLELGKTIWKLPYNEFDSYFLSYSLNTTFFWKGKLYVQFVNIHGCADKLNQLARVNPETGKIEEKKQSIAAIAGWMDGNGTAYIFQASLSCGDKYIAKFNLEDMSMQLLPAKDIYLPLGLANGRLVYTTTDSVLICDTEGKILETVKLGEITTGNCRLYGNTVYYINWSKLKWLDIPASS